MFNIYKTNQSNILIALMLTWLPIHAVTITDSLFKKNIFQVKVSNAFLISRISSFHYEYFPRAADDYYHNYTINEKSTLVNPDISISYNRRMGVSQNFRNRTAFSAYFSIELGWRSYTYENTKLGHSYGGIGWGTFTGTIQEKNTLQFLTFRPGFQANFSNYKKRVFALGIGLAWSRTFYINSNSFHQDELTNKEWTNTGRYDLRLSPRIVTNSQEDFFPKYDHFILDINASVGKLINHCMAGIFIRYSITEYTVFNKAYAHVDDASFLKNFHMVHVGLFADLACFKKN